MTKAEIDLIRKSLEKVLKEYGDDINNDRSLDVKVVVSNSSNFICASTDYAPDSTVCSKWAA